MHSIRVDRRHWLRQALAAGGAAWGLGACTLRSAGGPPPSSAALWVAPGIGVLPGAVGEPAPDNLGRTANLGFVVGRVGVLAVNAGVSASHGQALLQAIGQHTPLPVRVALLTQVRQEFVLGASALQAAGARVLMHASAARLMAGRCDGCLRQLQQLLSEQAMQHTRVAVPDDTFDGTQPPAAALDGVGRAVRILSFGPGGHSSGLGAAAVWDEDTRTLLAGGLLSAQTIPDVQDAHLEGWRAAWAALRALQPERIVPGFGPVAQGAGQALALIDANARYLEQLSDTTLRLLRQGVPLSEVAERAHLPEFATWALYGSVHRRNASVLYLHHERALLRGGG
ncbi:MAG: MBL fold metallo-hydrolase [Pseudomonadota bacterium]|nr:MBL fold metallo-hydrolase [Pseudomonadota bacterium]